MPKKNAFFYFIIDYKHREESKGRRFRGLQDVSRIAGPIWKDMDEQQRAPYVAKAKQGNEQDRKNHERLSCHGVPLSTLVAEERAVKSKTALIRSRVEKMIRNAAENNKLEHLEFYFVSCGYFCPLSDGRYVPAEIGAIRYSLEGGVMAKFHTLINPGPLPLGKSLEAKEHSNNFHQLPIPPDALGETNFEHIANKLLTFLQHSEKKMPLLFTDRNGIPHVESILTDILNAKTTGLEIVVCPLAEMFFVLKKTVLHYSLSLPEGFPSESVPQMLIDRDLYAYTENISCAFHEEKGNGVDCAQSRCVRWAYAISDSCCLDMHIDMLPGVHMPLNGATLGEIASRSHGLDSSSASSKQNSSEKRLTGTNPGNNAVFISGSDMSYGCDRGTYSNQDSSDSVGEERFEFDNNSAAGLSSILPSGLVPQVRGIGRGRRIQFDNTPPLPWNHQPRK
ncbi:protein maelstrom homolog [Anopheles ziemanni]|uniref:protein maelstrom homolog n=1 Tax=Anopheles ziemanni TaxID=345580 RepID=UPI00265ABA6A|nr:protein maelstrom homolog isoform X1 [Anopheles coustani]XP_058176010.1 protein maelstrom homolog [Anopheles ziemanni]